MHMHPGLYQDFSGISFGSCGTLGSTGPASTATCSPFYSIFGEWASNPAYLNVANGIQSWTAPSTGVYSFRAAGAHGGSAQGSQGSGTTPGGLGAVVSGTVSLTAGAVLYVVVGQPRARRAGRPGRPAAAAARRTCSSATSGRPLRLLVSPFHCTLTGCFWTTVAGSACCHSLPHLHQVTHAGGKGTALCTLGNRRWRGQRLFQHCLGGRRQRHRKERHRHPQGGCRRPPAQPGPPHHRAWPAGFQRAAGCALPDCPVALVIGFLAACTVQMVLWQYAVRTHRLFEVLTGSQCTKLDKDQAQSARSDNPITCCLCRAGWQRRADHDDHRCPASLRRRRRRWGRGQCDSNLQGRVRAHLALESNVLLCQLSRQGSAGGLRLGSKPFADLP